MASLDTFHPLDLPRAKLTRAAQHLGSLRDHVALVQQDRTSLEARYVPETRAYDLVIRMGKHPPYFLGLIVGDFIQNLRAALDLLAWQLVAGEDPDALDDERLARQIQFPICSSSEAFGKNKTVIHLPPRARELVQDRQPFKNLEEGTRLVNPLSILQALSNVDKHRVLIPALGKIEMDNILVRSDVQLDVDRATMLVEDATIVGDDTAFYRLPIPEGAPPEMSVTAWFAETPSVEFLVEDLGALTLDQFSDLLSQITDVIETVGGSVFDEAGDLEDRMQKWVTPPLD